MTANELITALREMKKTNPAEYAVFQKNYEEETTDDVAYWGVNDGYITLWKLHEEVEDFDCYEFGNKNCLGEEWGRFGGVRTRTITKEMMEYGDFCEREDEELGCSSCPKCETTYTQKQIDDGEVVPCNRCYKCFVGECGKDNCECEPEKEEAPVAPAEPTVVATFRGKTVVLPFSTLSDKVQKGLYEEKEAHDKKAMKEYVKARMNHLMGLGQKQMMDDGGDGAVECLFTRREEWDGEVFDNIICSLCDKRDGELNASKSGYEFSVGAEMTEKDDKVWEVSVSWSTLYDQNPFDDFYDEDEDNGSDSDDE